MGWLEGVLIGLGGFLGRLLGVNVVSGIEVTAYFEIQVLPGESNEGSVPIFEDKSSIKGFLSRILMCIMDIL